MPQIQLKEPWTSLDGLGLCAQRMRKRDDPPGLNAHMPLRQLIEPTVRALSLVFPVGGEAEPGPRLS